MKIIVTIHKYIKNRCNLYSIILYKVEKKLWSNCSILSFNAKQKNRKVSLILKLII